MRGGRALLGCGLLLPVVITAAVVLVGPATGAPSATCTYEQKQVRAKAAADYKRRMAADRAAYFKTHKSPKQRSAFVKAQQKKLAALRRGAACTVPPLPPSSAASCAFQLAPHPGGQMSEGRLDPRLFRPSTGRLDAVIVFLDYPDAPGGSDPAPLAQLLRPDPAWFEEVSYGRVTMSISAPVTRWIRMPEPTAAYMPTGRKHPPLRPGCPDGCRSVRRLLAVQPRHVLELTRMGLEQPGDLASLGGWSAHPRRWNDDLVREPLHRGHRATRLGNRQRLDARGATHVRLARSRRARHRLGSHFGRERPTWADPPARLAQVAARLARAGPAHLPQLTRRRRRDADADRSARRQEARRRPHQRTRRVRGGGAGEDRLRQVRVRRGRHRLHGRLQAQQLRGSHSPPRTDRAAAASRRARSGPAVSTRTGTSRSRYLQPTGAITASA